MHDPFHTLQVTHRSGAVTAGGTFVAIKGQVVDGVDYIVEAVQRGARKIVVAEGSIIPTAGRAAILAHGVELVFVPNTRYALAELSAHAYGYPATSLTLIGITGTKGKTTVSWLTYHILRHAGIAVALLSTILNRIGDDIYSTELTTQHPDYIHAFLRQCVDRGITHVVIEVAAQAVTLHRIVGLSFARIVWLNFSQEHGEFYPTEAEYYAAKAGLLSFIDQQCGMIVLNGDDSRIASCAQNQQVPVLVIQRSAILLPPYAHSSKHDLKNLSAMPDWLSISCEYEGMRYVCSGLTGTYNGENVLAAVMLARSLFVAPEAIAHSLKTFSGVPGRMNMYRLPHDGWACIDYAHNPSSFIGILQELRARASRIIVIFGCGGNRDPQKRPVMGLIATQYADYVIVTTDNPRYEDPQHIVQDIMAGIPPEAMDRVTCIADREMAIKHAYALSDRNTIIALLGKGPNEYQLVNGIKYPLSERMIIQGL